MFDTQDYQETQNGTKYKVKYQVFELSETRRNNEFTATLKKRQGTGYFTVLSEDDMFDTKSEALEWGLEQYEHTAFTVIEVYQKVHHG